jgi:HK97 gp10 family phage protein
MADLEITVNTKELEQLLEHLPQKIANQYLRSAAQKAGDAILAPMKALTPERTDEKTPNGNSLEPGALREDLTTQVTLTKHGVRVKIGPTAATAHVCRWQNNGYMLTSHNGKQIKQIPGKHFMEGASDESGQTAVDAFVDDIQSSLNTDNASSGGGS